MNFPPEVFFGLGGALLLAVLIWGMIQYKSRNRANDRVTEKAAERFYDNPEAYDRKRPDLEKEVRPS
ncbi:hypothetical protein [Caulobacter sp. LARHSG274]